MEARAGVRYVLDASPLPAGAPAVLDPDQQRVVAHRSGPLLVLAGPGTGKTTTIVEAIAARITDPHDPLPADRVLALTFGKRAAGELRDRVVARLGGGILPTIATFHAFAYALMRQYASVEQYREPPRLLSGAEEDVRIRDLLMGAIADGTIAWPEDLAGAVGTLGLANEVRAVLARAKELQLEPRELVRIGAASGRPAWQAIGALARQESDIMVLEHVVDYVELLHRAVLWARSPEGAGVVRDRFGAIYVDEYQDTDPLQVALLEALIGPRTMLVAVGDPDQSIYGFRGADARGIAAFPERFRRADGSPAPILVLQRTRRFGQALRDAASRVIDRRPLRMLPADLAHAHRHPRCEGDRESAVRVQSFDGELARAAHIGEQIRIAHLRDQVPWRQMAILVRSATDIPLLERALLQAQVPVAIAADEVPLRQEPAVAVLLNALEIACDPTRASARAAVDLLAGPLADLDATDLRRLGRLLRQAERAASPDVAPPPSDELLRDLVRGQRALGEVAVADAELAASVERVRALIDRAHAQVRGGSTPQDVLWTLWSGQAPRSGARADGGRAHGWAERLRRAALGGSLSAHHDIDAVMALFETAERTQARYRGVVGIRSFLISLRDQQIPAEPIAERSVAADAVRILTAHRAKGLEWDRVWIVGAEEGRWPDLRPRGSVLEPDRLTREGLGDGVRAAELLDEERRLFYVALTRARDQVTVTTVQVQDDSGHQPSRFIADLEIPVEHIVGRPVFTASMHGLVARLRGVLHDGGASPALREAAAQRLAQLAMSVDDAGEPLVPVADPDRWWGLLERSPGAQPVRRADAPIALSGSGLDGILDCPLRWYLEHDAHAEVPRPPATKFGSVVHAIADYVAKGAIPADLDAADPLVDRVWRELRFESVWQSQAERAEARAALARFLAYHVRADRELVDTEREYVAILEVPTPSGGVEAIRLRGFMDRVERDGTGRAVAIDLKNMRTPPPDSSVPEHGQLGVYQVLLREAGEEVGGAALVQLRAAAAPGADDPKVQLQDALPAERPTWVELELGEAAELLRSERFPARPSRTCMYCQFQLVCPSQPRGEQVVP